MRAVMPATSHLIPGPSSVTDISTVNTEANQEVPTTPAK